MPSEPTGSVSSAGSKASREELLLAAAYPEAIADAVKSFRAARENAA